MAWCELSLVCLFFLLLSVTLSGSSVPCYNSTCRDEPQNGPSEGALEIVWCGVSDGSSASCGPAGIGGGDNRANITCDERQYQQSCLIRPGTDDSASTTCEEEEWVANLQHELLYRSEYDYAVHLNWDPHPNTSYYRVTILHDSSKKLGCNSHINGTEFWFSADYPKDDLTFAKLTVKVVPEGSCRAVRVNVPVPSDCFHLCPGMCSCINDYRHALELAPPTNVTTCVAGSDGSNVTLMIAWDKMETYYINSPHQTYHLAISNASAVVTDTIQVTGATSVYLHLRGVVMTRSYSVQVTELICQHKLKANPASISFQPCQNQTPPTSQATPTRTSSTTGDGGMLESANSANVSEPASPTATTIKMEIQPTISIFPVNTNHKTVSASLSIATPISTTHTSLLSRDSNVGIIMSILIAGVVITALIFSLMFMMKRYLSRYKKNIVQPIKADKAKKTVLVLFSQASSMKDELSVMEHVVKALLMHDIHCLYFDKPRVTSNVVEWVEGGIKRSDKVLLVVNKEFVMEWNSLKAYLPHGESLVYIAKQLIHGFIMRDKQKLNKFAMVFLRKEDQNDLLKDSLFLHSLKSYLILPKAVGELEGLVRFILNKPTYTLSAKT